LHYRASCGNKTSIIFSDGQLTENI